MNNLEKKINISLHQNDLADNINFAQDLAIDCETMGLNYHRDKLCLLQISDGRGEVHLVKFTDQKYNAPILKKLLEDPIRQKIFHFGRFDIAMINKYLSIDINNIFCTKIASKLARTYTDLHGLKELCRELLSINISKQQQSSDWGNINLSEEQLKYAANDVIYLHQIKEKLTEILIRENRFELAKSCFEFLKYRAKLDLAGWDLIDIFAH